MTAGTRFLGYHCSHWKTTWVRMRGSLSAKDAKGKQRKRHRTSSQEARACLQKGRDELLTFYAFPAWHWQSLRTTNPIESTFGTIRHRTRRTKGCLTRNGMLHMMFKLGQSAEKTWRRLRGFKQLPKVIERIHSVDGIEEKGTNSVAA